jgi:hypothetical protein
MIRTLTVTAAALVLSVTAHAQTKGADFPIKYCFALVVTLPDGPKATLNMDGTWTVPSWDAVERETTMPPIRPGDVTACVARSLVAHRAELRFSPIAPKCTAESYAESNMRRITTADPIMHDCGLTAPH